MTWRLPLLVTGVIDLSVSKADLEALDDVAANASSCHSAYSLALEVVGVLGQARDVPFPIYGLLSCDYCFMVSQLCCMQMMFAMLHAIFAHECASS